MKILALIPARGGSKSIPQKNILPIAGKPLIAWTIEHALKSNLINRVIVSTDDNLISEVSESFGAEVPFKRPTKISQDDSLDIEAFIHALVWLKENENYVPDLIVHLRPTGPAREINIIDEAIEKIISNPKADSLRSISLAKQNPFKMWFYSDKNSIKPVITHEHIKDSHSVARQMLPKAYWQNGYVDIVRPDTILDKKSMTGDIVIPFEVEKSCDLDYFEDIPQVEKDLKRIINKDKFCDRKDKSNKFPS